MPPVALGRWLKHAPRSAPRLRSARTRRSRYSTGNSNYCDAARRRRASPHALAIEARKLNLESGVPSLLRPDPARNPRLCGGQKLRAPARHGARDLGLRDPHQQNPCHAVNRFRVLQNPAINRLALLSALSPLSLSPPLRLHLRLRSRRAAPVPTPRT